MVAVVHPDVEERLDLAEDPGLDAEGGKLLVVADRGRPEIADVVINDPNVDAMPGLLDEDVEDLVPHLAGLDDEKLDEDVMPRLGKLALHRREGIVAEREIRHLAIEEAISFRPAVDEAGDSVAVLVVGLEFPEGLGLGVFHPEDRIVVAEIPLLLPGANFMGEKNVKNRPDDRDGDHVEKPDDLVFVLAPRVDDEDGDHEIDQINGEKHVKSLRAGKRSAG